MPAVILTVFAVGEAGTEAGWWGHLVQLAAVAAPLALAWWWPRVGGPLLLAVGGVFSVLMLGEGGETASTKLLAVGLLFAPLFVAGVFFTLAARAPRRESPARR